MPNWPAILGPERIAKGLFWTKAWSLVSGCTPCSPGCRNCWLAAMHYRFHPDDSLTVGSAHQPPHFTGRIITHPDRLAIPLKTRKPQVFAIWSDLFHEKVPWQFKVEALNVMAQCEKHLFLIITKRPEGFAEIIYRLGESVPGDWAINANLEVLGNLGPNIILITAAENQEQADKRLPIALQIPAACRMVLYEPALGVLSSRWKWVDIKEGLNTEYDGLKHFHGVIAGAETGPHARPAHPDRFRQVRDDCAAAGVPFFLKHHNKTAGRLLDGQEHNELPNP